MEGQEHRVYHTKVDSSGRILLSSEVRQRLHLETGDTVAIVETERGVEVKTLAQLVKDAQDYFCSLSPADSVWSEELLAERRAEAARE
jgi:AbrB family looped-hinge helix DNA binding protein